MLNQIYIRINWGKVVSGLFTAFVGFLITYYFGPVIGITYLCYCVGSQ